CFFFQAEDGIRDRNVTGVQTCALPILKVETTEPSLVGWGCATFTQRALVVQTAVEQYLKPFLIGRNVDEIEDIWQSSYVSSYWRSEERRVGKECRSGWGGQRRRRE